MDNYQNPKDNPAPVMDLGDLEDGDIQEAEIEIFEQDRDFDNTSDKADEK